MARLSYKVITQRFQANRKVYWIPSSVRLENAFCKYPIDIIEIIRLNALVLGRQILNPLKMVIFTQPNCFWNEK